MASLEHDHIVQVFSETVEPSQNLRLICMQYVPGTTLGKVLRWLGEHVSGAWDGEQFLDAVDALTDQMATLHPAALRDREWLHRADFVQAVCWLGGRLADALAYAHARGVIHRDLKPDNVLITPYGRPLLVDFNLSLDPHQVAGTTIGLFGGSLGYMAPEHLDAFNPGETTSPDVVDARSDIYALGVVLYEMLTGELPFPALPGGGDGCTLLRDMAAERRNRAPSPRQHNPHVTSVLDRIVRRCLEPEPERRYASAAALANALGSAAELHRTEKALPAAGWFTRLAMRHPFSLVMIPNFLPSLVCLALFYLYQDQLQIIHQLTPSQRATWDWLWITFVPAAFSLGVVFTLGLVFRWYRRWQRGLAEGDAPSVPLPVRRRRVVAVPWLAVIICGGNWLGNSLSLLGLFHLLAGPLPEELFLHITVATLLGGVTSLTYTYFGAEFFTLRVFYPALWNDEEEPRQVARRELRFVARRIRLFQLIALVIPLFGAALMVAGGLDDYVVSPAAFRWFVLFFIALGLLGACITTYWAGFLGRTLTALTLPSPALGKDSLKFLR
jgi:hypothetical protein